MASGVVPVWMLRDQSVSSSEVLVYLAASVRSGNKFDVSEIAALAKLRMAETQTAIVMLLARGDLEVRKGRLYLGPLGGEVS